MQIFVILAPLTRGLFTDSKAADFGKRLILAMKNMPSATQGVFFTEGIDTLEGEPRLVGTNSLGIIGADHMAFTAVRASAVIGDDVQIEIRYMESFDPLPFYQKNLIDHVEAEFRDFLKNSGLPPYTLSVLCASYSYGVFKRFGKDSPEDSPSIPKGDKQN